MPPNGQLLKKSCLKQNYSLRTQLLMSFGSAAFVALALSVIVSIVILVRAGDVVKSRSTMVMEEQLHENFVVATISTADMFGKLQENHEGLIHQMGELVLDRIVGYPEDGWEDDKYVPFADMDSQQRNVFSGEFSTENVYPIKAEPVPLDWRITMDITEENAGNIAPGRENWLDAVKHIASYSTAGFFFQGVCDPEMKSPTWVTYYQNCSDANNYLTTGGIIRPSNKIQGLHRKSAELGLLFRPLFEASSDVFSMGIHYFNDAAGASMNYPGHLHNGLSVTYNSAGCEWMRNVNPRTGRPYGTEEQISKCHPRGEMVWGREYNPNEREWFQHFVLNGQGKAVWYGPYSVGGSNIVRLSVGKALYDRRTGELIGVVALDIHVQDLGSNLENSRLYDNSEWGLLDFTTGEVLVDSFQSATKNVNATSQSETISTKWSDLGILSDMSFMRMRDVFLDALSKEWTLDSLKEAATESIHNCYYGLSVAYPLPVPPSKHDKNYSPKYLLVHVVTSDIYSPITDLNETVDDDIRTTSMVACVVAILGMIVILAILWCVARALTQPLLWMEMVSWRIVNHGDEWSGENFNVEDENDTNATVRCAPRTEITDLVEEFRKMIKGFSGDGASNVAEPEMNEVRNTLTWQSDFRQLYTKPAVKPKPARSNTSAQTPSTERDGTAGSGSSSGSDILDEPSTQEPSVQASAQGPSGTIATFETGLTSRLGGAKVCPAPRKIHTGPVSAVLGRDDKPDGKEMTGVVYRSRLFWGIVMLIVVPLSITNIMICALVTSAISNTVPDWVDVLEDESFELEVRALSTIVKSKSRLLELILNEPSRDLLFSARIANWLHFGAIERAESFTSTLSATEECKAYNGACPLLETSDYQCPCLWEDSTVDTCSAVANSSQARHLQKRFFAAQAQDYNPLTGERQGTSYPQLAFSPESTAWFSNISDIPGSWKGSNASGFETMYDRLRVSAALAAIDFPIYNYQVTAGRSRQWLGSFTAYESDGMMTGFSGCSQIHSGLASFVSDDVNKAFEVSSIHCPKGKYGYDPRCRYWYKVSKDKFFESKQSYHVTAPYVFAVTNSIGLSAASPIANPATGEFAGVALVDFVPMGLTETFATLMESSYVITPEEDVYGGDVVAMTRHESHHANESRTSSWEPRLLVDEIFHHDDDPKRKEAYRDGPVQQMKSGLSGSALFALKTVDGEVKQAVTVFSPVNQLVVSAIDPSDLIHGVKAENMTIFSVAITCYEEMMREPFASVKDDVNDELFVLSVIDAILVLAFTLAFLAIAGKITVHVTRPMITLLNAVRSINSKEDKRDIPPLEGGSREVHQVYNSFSKLCKVVRVSNTAFFSGNLVWAHHIVEDAIQLFRKIEDRKAIGMACNNLGNIMFARILEVGKQNGSSLDIGYGISALLHYDEAVNISQVEFDECAVMEVKADLAQELSDRLFNRALCRLFMEGVPESPPGLRQMALEDLARSRDLDYDVKEFLIETKLLLERSEQCFNRILRRIHGLCTYYSDEDVRIIWDATSLLTEADELLFAAWHERSAPLFDEVTRVGRLQQLEGAAIRLEGCKGNHGEAARVGMRMFTEDEYLLEGPFALASAALMHFAKIDDEVRWAPKTISTVRSDLKKMARICRSPTLDLGKSVIFAFELNERWETEDIFPMINSKCMNLFDIHCTQEDYVGVVAYTVDGDHTIELSPKADYWEQQRNVLNLATKSASERISSALPYAMQVVLDSSTSQEMDTYILLFTDGYSWDPEPYAQIKWQLTRMNRESERNIHLIIFGLDVEPEHIDEVRSMCSVSKGSYYVDLTTENIDETFSSLCSLFAAGLLYQEFLSTITMQKF